MINQNTVFAASGEYSDYQYICSLLDDLHRQEYIYDDNHEYGPQSYGKYVANLCYKRRGKGDPYLIEGIMAGYKGGERYLGYIDFYGTYLENNFVLTGFARHLCGHILNTRWNPDIELPEAISIIEECFKALYARNCQAEDNLRIVVINDEGIRTDAKKYLKFNFLDWKLNGIMRNSSTNLQLSLNNSIYEKWFYTPNFLEFF